MSVNSVNSTPSKEPVSKTIADSVIQQGKNMLIGAAAGTAAGGAVSLVAPVSKNKIAQEVTDYFVKNIDKNDPQKAKVLADALFTKKKYDDNEFLSQIVNEIKKSPNKISKFSDKIKELLENIGKPLSEGAELKADEVIKTFETYIKQNEVTKGQFESAVNTLNEIADGFRKSAADMVKEYFNKPRKQRAADDIVAIAKKAAKSSQRAKIIGTAAGVGMIIMMFSELFENVFSKKSSKVPNAAQNVALDKLNTHQG